MQKKGENYISQSLFYKNHGNFFSMMEEFLKINKRIDPNKCVYVGIFSKILIKVVYYYSEL